uniref:F-box domain-containing protein n=1 Tax=Steinernema glaseri TaxID=37863 RepID=A0A1I7ZYN8_9BILA
MNGLPSEFYERVCELLDGSVLLEAEKLSGVFGEYAQIAWRYKASYVSAVQDGVETQGFLHCDYSGREVRTPEEIQAVPKRFVWGVMIHFLDGKQENVSRAIAKRFPYAEYQFSILSSSINETWVDFACSLKRLTYVVIKKKLDDDSVGLFQKLIARQKLSYLEVHEEACNEAIQEVLKSFFCKNQFGELKVRGNHYGAWNSAIVRTLLQHWAENSKKLIGKRLVLEGNCEGGVQQLEDFVLQRAGVSPTLPQVNGSTILTSSLSHFGMHFALKVCSKEECQDAGPRSITFIKPSCIYKYEEGEKDERRRLYIAFECANEEERRTGGRKLSASHEGRNDLSLMRTTSLLHVFFG